MFQKIKEIVDAGKRFLVTSHIDPDGDAVGSTLAMHYALTRLGKDSSVYLKDRIPYRYQFLPQPAQLVHELPTEEFDAIFVLDCGNFFRVGNGYEALKKNGTIINIDHHDTNEAFGYVNILDERASSAAEIVYLILKSLNVPFDFNIAVNLYTAILTDTGSFRYENTNSQAFTICQEMTHHGVLPHYVAEQVYESHPKERFVLLCKALSTLETFRGDKVAVLELTEEMFRTTNTSREYTDGFVEFLKEMKGLEVAVVMRQLNRNSYKISLRSKGAVDVALVARSFGGGGHRKAAGCVIDGTAAEVKKSIVEAIPA